jgi:nuclear receptor subfamily 2 group E member 3
MKHVDVYARNPQPSSGRADRKWTGDEICSLPLCRGVEGRVNCQRVLLGGDNEVDNETFLSNLSIVFPAVQHERAPKISNVTSSSQGLTYAANLYAARHTDGVFPFQMHFPTPVGFPLEHYYMPSPYYPHLAESLNLKLNQSVYKPHLATTSGFELLTNNLLTRVPTTVEAKPAVETREKENEVTSSEEIPKLRSTQSLYESATKLLFVSIRWAKSIPSFNQLSLSDQKRLLNDSWAELFVIAASQWGLSIDEEAQAKTPFLKLLQSVIKYFGSLKIDHFEAACLKALILFRGDFNADQATTQHQILLLQNQTLSLLLEKCGGLRFGHLLYLILPQIRIVGNVQSLQVRRAGEAIHEAQ